MLSLELAKQGIESAAVAEECDSISSSSLPLFHYTDANGLYGILKDKCLWATDFRFLNDKSEYVFGLGLVSAALGKRTDPLSKILSEMWNRTQEHLPLLTLYVASLCEEGDLLSQWRSYARLHDGYALAFNPDKLTLKPGCQLLKAVYSKDRQREIIENILDVSQGLILGTSSDDTESLVRHALATLLRVTARFKDASFEGEREWRIICFGHKGPQFRVSSGHITPYVEIKLESRDLNHVVQGPGNFRTANARAVEQFAASRGFDALQVKTSEVPIG
jgi:hypothetical protein